MVMKRNLTAGLCAASHWRLLLRSCICSNSLVYTRSTEEELQSVARGETSLSFVSE